MNKSYRLAPIALVLAATFFSTAVAEEALTIATFNCEFLTRPKVHVKFGLGFNLNDTEDAEWTQAFRDQRFAEATRAVARVIHGIDADVIALTEVGNAGDVAELREAVADLGTSYPHFEVGHSTDHTTKQHVAVFSRFPITDVVESIPGREFYLGEIDDPETEKHTGVSKGMRVTINAHGRKILLYAIHLASERGGHEQDQQRIAQASIVRRHYLPEIQDGELVIVAGDLNDDRGQPTLHRIRGLDDMFDDLIQTGLPNYFEDNEVSTRWTYEFQGVRRQIDHVLLSFTVKDETTSSGIETRTVDHGDPLASDHRPLVVTLTLDD
jgi:endonuclease/exonuclease/phosphatase family metal-dependent hydrolase